MIPIYSLGPIISVKQMADGRTVPVYGQGQLVGMIRTANELSQLFVLHIYAELQFKKEKRPYLAKRALVKAKKYSNLSLNARFKENGVTAPSPKLADAYFRITYKWVIENYPQYLADVIIAQ